MLPLWRRILVDRCCAVLIVRDPVEVAWSVALRDGVQVLTGFALWGAYNRSALAGLAGLPVHVCRYEDLVEQPEVALVAMAEALQGFGQLAADADVAAGVAVVQPELRRNTWPRSQTDLLEVPADLRHLEKELGGHLGTSPRFEADVPDPGWWERSLLEERRVGGLRLRASAASRGLLEVRVAELEAAHRQAGADNEVLATQLAEVALRVEAETARAAGLAQRAESAEAALARADDRWTALERRAPVRLYRVLQRLVRPVPPVG